MYSIREFIMRVPSASLSPAEREALKETGIDPVAVKQVVVDRIFRQRELGMDVTDGDSPDETVQEHAQLPPSG